MSINLGMLATRFGCELVGDPEYLITGVGTLRNASHSDLSFFSNIFYKNDLINTKAGVVILQPEDKSLCSTNCLLNDNPYLTYALIASEISPPSAIDEVIHDSAVLDDSIEVSKGVHIGPNAVVGENVILMDNVFVGPGVVIGSDCIVKNETKLLANSILYENVQIGERCIIHPGAVLGSDGFGHAKGRNGWVKVPQLGGVRIGNDVEIGSNSTIDSGAIDNTVVDDGVRIDNQVQIGHNVHIGAHSALASSVAVAGSATIGKRCMIAGQVGVVGHINICDDVVVTGATMVSKSINSPGTFSGGFPGMEAATWKKLVARFRRSSYLDKKLKALEKKILDLVSHNE